MAAANTDKFRKVARRWTGAVGSSGINDAVVTTLPLSSATNLPTDTATDLTFERVDANGAKTPTVEETATVVISVGSDNGTNAVRGAEGTAQAHTAGKVVENLWNAKTWNDAVDGILVQHNQDGTHKSALVTTLKATGATINTGTDDATIVTPKAIADSTIGAAWAAWTPTLGGITKGSGTLSCAYTRIGKTIHGRFHFIMAADSSVTGSVTFTLPVTSISYPGTATTEVIGPAILFDQSSAVIRGVAVWASTTTARIQSLAVSGALILPTNLSSTAPMTWTTLDEIDVQFTYEAA